MRLVLWIFILLIGLSGLTLKVYGSTKHLYEVENYIEDYFKNLPDHHRIRALSYAPLIVHWSEKYQVDPLLMTVIIAYESSFRSDVIGDNGKAFGLMQVRWPPSLRGFDMSNPSDQIHAGVKHFSINCFIPCDYDIEESLTAYATGGCHKKFKGLRKRMRNYYKAIRIYRK